jgi:hypothetical protein
MTFRVVPRRTPMPCNLAYGSGQDEGLSNNRSKGVAQEHGQQCSTRSVCSTWRTVLFSMLNKLPIRPPEEPSFETEKPSFETENMLFETEN